MTVSSNRCGGTSRRDDELVRNFFRAALTVSVCKLDPYVDAKQFMQRNWSETSRDIEVMTRAAVNPASLTGSGWADTLTRVSYALLGILAPLSAGASLLQRAIQLDINGAASITLPTFAPGIVSFVGEGSPIPVQKFAATGPSVTPRKLAAIVELSHELLTSGDAETLIRAVLTESLGKSLDGILFDANAGDAVRPPGLRYNVAGLTPTGTGEKVQVMIDDVIALVSAVGAQVGGPVVLIAAVPQAAALNLRSFGALAQNYIRAAR
jgi:hypothetical protein